MRWVKTMMAILVASVLGMSVAFAGTVSPVGKWQTIDDVTKKPRSIITITEDSQGQLSGKVTKAYYRPGEGPDDVCVKCTGALHNQKMLGLVILTGMKQSPKDPLFWSGGQIVDPESGKTYKCNITLAPDGKSLKIRGYIGISLIGRTQTWNKM